MRKAILNKKDQVLHKLILFEAMDSSSVMNKFIDHESLLKMFKNMVVFGNGTVKLKNITDMHEYNRLSFYYETIIHDYSKKYNINEDQFKILVTECNSLHELKDAIGYYEYKDMYKSWVDQQDEKHTYPKVDLVDTPETLVGFRGSL